MTKRVLRGRQEYADILEERDERAIFRARLMGRLVHWLALTLTKTDNQTCQEK